jgi:broad specificity phosphatase PhoE
VQTIFYVRHGTSVFNIERRFGGTVDTPLAPQGVEEAQRAATSAKRLRIDRIVSSPLSRCTDTAGIIARQIGYPPSEIVVSELLIERSFGPLEGEPLRPESEFAEVGGVETSSQLNERAGRANEWLTGLDAEHLLICGHGVFGRALRRTFLSDAPSDQARDLDRPIPNAVIECWRRACSCCTEEEFAQI